MQMPSTKTLYTYWNTIRGSRSAPDRRDIDPTRIREALANTFILETDGADKFSFRLAGSHLCTSYCRELKGRSFSALWHDRDGDAMDTLLRAVTEDHAVALVTFQGTTALQTKVSFETILMPLRHNGSTHTRILGAMTALDEPYWLGVQPVLEQRITGLRLIWPDEISAEETAREVLASVVNDVDFAHSSTPSGLPTTVFGRTARRYAHLAVIDGGRN
ncbi:PAS domain-containing protein [Devosia sp. XJ19-1]|uniref:PAS domain-containing protein n=1 Tax=Devosia ureilytica TaxID=2952754 RepID=A0A9Q4ALD2_9HYPH|nr:PAS domain-containing protein [Devosia ureilytica]MCP8881886.1 PAS domain-containing protein [Devosia ureilytica]MCP8886228.1 PAS domain-containing protein [Devosia ureilytica]